MADPSDYFGNNLYRTLGSTAPFGAIPFALAGNMPASSWAMCGRLQVGKKNHHVAALVGAAMCSAFLRGSQ